MLCKLTTDESYSAAKLQSTDMKWEHVRWHGVHYNTIDYTNQPSLSPSFR